jgi:hypothetical protein
MILTVPYQALEVDNIHISPFIIDKYGKSISKLSYKDNSVDFHDVSILTPPLKVIDYNSDSSRLRLDLSEQPHFQAKFSTIQDNLTSTFFIHQQTFINKRNECLEYIRSLFHFLLENNVLSLYIFPSTVVKKENGETFKISELKADDVVRCVIRLQGITQYHNKYDIRLRLQHSVGVLWAVSLNAYRDIADTAKALNDSPSVTQDNTSIK